MSTTPESVRYARCHASHVGEFYVLIDIRGDDK